LAELLAIHIHDKKGLSTPTEVGESSSQFTQISKGAVKPKVRVITKRELLAILT
jgi:hypothetical protein